MDNSERLAKNMAIKEKGVETRTRHKSMRCVVITTKVVMNKLTKTQKEQLFGQFREAKWIYNSILNRSKNGDDLFQITYKDFETVNHLDKNRDVVTEEVKYLSKREVQSVVSGIKSNITALSASKKRGNKVGELRFISDYNSIDLPQYIKSYKIVGKNKLKLDKINGNIRVRGLKQLWDITDKYEIANAKLLKKPDGLYVSITIYIEPSEKHDNIPEKPLIGIDMGCETSFTLSNGEKIDIEVKETERLKRLQRSLARCEKGSHNRWKIRRKLRSEYQHISNKRDDLAKKVLHKLSFYRVVTQDDQLRLWMEGGHGSKVCHGVLGRVKKALAMRSDIFLLSQWVPTTKLCSKCGNILDISLSDRTFVCPVCGETEDRDVHAAKNMLWFFNNRKTLCVGRTEYNREEFNSGIRDIFGETNHETAKSLA